MHPVNLRKRLRKKIPKKFEKKSKIMLTSLYALGIITEHLEKVGPVAQVVRAHP